MCWVNVREPGFYDFFYICPVAAINDLKAVATV
jgi:hypothetical protein